MSAPPPPVISVVVPCHDSQRFLGDTVASVLAQEHGDWELILVDDGSSDDTLVLAQQLAAAQPPGRIRVLQQPNQGVAAARNTGMAAARGRYLLPLDADDLLAPNFLGACAAALDADPAIAIAAPDREDFGEITGTWSPGPFTLERLRYFNQLPYACLVRRELWQSIGGYRSNVDGFDDWNFWIAAAAAGTHACHVPGARLLHRRRGDSFMWRLLDDFERLHARIILNEAQAFAPAEVLAARAFLAGGPMPSFLGVAKTLYLGRYYASYAKAS